MQYLPVSKDVGKGDKDKWINVPMLKVYVGLYRFNDCESTDECENNWLDSLFSHFLSFPFIHLLGERLSYGGNLRNKLVERDHGGAIGAKKISQ